MRDATGWTGGQYSIFRVLLGAVLACRLSEVAGDGSGATPLLATAGALGAAALAAGWRDRLVALPLLVLWCALFPPVSGMVADLARGIPPFLLLLHALLPGAPYGSWDARGRADPADGWALPPRAHAAPWVALALLYGSFGALAALPSAAGPEQHQALAIVPLVFAALCLVRRVRPALWLAMSGVQVVLFAYHGASDAGIAWLLLHAAAFDPAWVPARRFAGGGPRVYYDGSCGLCHTTVRFLLAEDRSGAIRYAPFASEAFASERDLPADLPDSVIVRVDDHLLVRSAGMLALGAVCGGLWRVLAVVIGLVPRTVLDWCYDRVAAVRHRLFRRPKSLCPIVPPALRERFLP